MKGFKKQRQIINITKLKWLQIKDKIINYTQNLQTTYRQITYEQSNKIRINTLKIIAFQSLID